MDPSELLTTPRCGMDASIEDLERLAQLRWAGSLTDDEFAGLKAKLFASPAAPSPWTTAPANGNLDAQTIQRLAEYVKLSGIVWIVIGALQICMILTAIAGVWNVLAGLSRLASAKEITRRDASVVESFRGSTQLVVLGLINFWLGAVFGVVMIGLDFYFRDQILKHEHLFTEQSPDTEVNAQTLAPSGTVQR